MSDPMGTLNIPELIELSVLLFTLFPLPWKLWKLGPFERSQNQSVAKHELQSTEQCRWHCASSLMPLVE